jgi:hypothetical protein
MVSSKGNQKVIKKKKGWKRSSKKEEVKDLPRYVRRLERKNKKLRDEIKKIKTKWCRCKSNSNETINLDSDTPWGEGTPTIFVNDLLVEDVITILNETFGDDKVNISLEPEGYYFIISTEPIESILTIKIKDEKEIVVGIDGVPKDFVSRVSNLSEFKTTSILDFKKFIYDFKKSLDKCNEDTPLKYNVYKVILM